MRMFTYLGNLWTESMCNPNPILLGKKESVLLTVRINQLFSQWENHHRCLNEQICVYFLKGYTIVT